MECNRIYPQDCTLQDLIGKWNVEDWKMSLHSHQTEYGKKLFLKQYVICLKTQAIIDTNGIKINNVCDFEGCNYNFIKRNKFKKFPIIKNISNSERAPGQEIIEHERVSEAFLGLLDRNYSSTALSKDSLLIFDTFCEASFGDFTLKICVVNKNRIGLFSGADLIILTR